LDNTLLVVSFIYMMLSIDILAGVFFLFFFRLLGSPAPRFLTNVCLLSVLEKQDTQVPLSSVCFLLERSIFPIHSESQEKRSEVKLEIRGATRVNLKHQGMCQW
jgi:hypothetical protein